MQSDPYLPLHTALTTCTWCGAQSEETVSPSQSDAAFCTRTCEINANFWLYQEMRLIELNQLLSSPENLYDSPEDPFARPEDQYDN